MSLKALVMMTLQYNEKHERRLSDENLDIQAPIVQCPNETEYTHKHSQRHEIREGSSTPP
jgi:hypothetical protein